MLYDPIAWLPSNFTDACDIHHKKQKNKSREERERESETERIEVLMILIPKKSSISSVEV